MAPMGMVAALVRTSFLVNAVYVDSAREFGLTAQQGQLLCVLMAGPYGMGELSGTLGLAKSSTSGLVERSERHGLVRRKADKHDTRAVRVELTPAGRRCAEAFHQQTCERIDALGAGLPAAEKEALGTILGRIVAENAVPVVFL